MKLRNTNILITGGGSGIGKAIAKRFAEVGARVVICGKTPEKLADTVAEIGKGNVFAMEWDIADADAFKEKITEANAGIGQITAFVNAAARGTEQVTGRCYEPWDITPDEWDALCDSNFKGAFFMMRNEVDYFLQNGIRGNILNIASNAAYTGVVGSYGAAKLSMIQWTREFGKKYGHDGIIINGIAPGATFTPMISQYAKSIDQKYERHAIERFIRPDEIAELAYYLMSDYGEIICGHTVVADGGDRYAK